MAVAEEQAKRALHALVDALSEDRARLLLRGLREGDRTALYLASLPEDDEPVTDEERAAVTGPRRRSVACTLPWRPPRRPPVVSGHAPRGR